MVLFIASPSIYPSTLATPDKPRSVETSTNRDNFVAMLVQMVVDRGSLFV